MYAELVVEATRVNWSDLALFTQRFYIATYYCVDYVSENLKQGQGILNEATCPLCRKQKLTKQGNTTFFFFCQPWEQFEVKSALNAHTFFKTWNLGPYLHRLCLKVIKTPKVAGISVKPICCLKSSNKIFKAGSPNVELTGHELLIINYNRSTVGRVTLCAISLLIKDLILS